MPIAMKFWRWFEPLWKAQAGHRNVKIGLAVLISFAGLLYLSLGPLVFDATYWLLGKITRTASDRRLRVGVSVALAVVYIVAVSVSDSAAKKHPAPTGGLDAPIAAVSTTGPTGRSANPATPTPLTATATPAPTPTPTPVPTPTPKPTPTATPAPTPTPTPVPTPTPKPTPTAKPTHPPTPTPTPIPLSYATLSSRDWALLVKAPDNYMGKAYKVWACISQFDAATGTDSFRAQASYRQESYWYTNGSNAVFTGDESQLADYVESDMVVMNVLSLGSLKYGTQIGGSTTAPAFMVVDITRKGSCG
jgi:hypothetical protein